MKGDGRRHSIHTTELIEIQRGVAEGRKTIAFPGAPSWFEDKRGGDFDRLKKKTKGVGAREH